MRGHSGWCVTHVYVCTRRRHPYLTIKAIISSRWARRGGQKYREGTHDEINNNNIIIEGLSLLQSIPPTTANKQTQTQKKKKKKNQLIGNPQGEVGGRTAC